MTAGKVLAELRRLGGRLAWRDGDRLVVEAPPGAVSPELAAALRRHKEEWDDPRGLSRNGGSTGPGCTERGRMGPASSDDSWCFIVDLA